MSGILSTLARARIPMQFDIRFSDVITPEPTDTEYPSSLDFVRLCSGHPKETVVAEKLEALTVLGLDVGGAGKACPLAERRQGRMMSDRLGHQNVLIVHQPDSDTHTAFVAKERSDAVQAPEADAHQLTNLETHSRWDAYGNCSGKLKGSHLEEVILEPEFWFERSEFDPGTAVFTVKNNSTR